MAQKKKNDLSVTPLMALSMMAIFALMPIMFGLANSRVKQNKSYAKYEPVSQTNPTPTPTTEPGNSEEMRLRITQ